MNKMYIKFKTTPLDEKHEFKESYSTIYKCKEYVYTGYLRRGLKFNIVDENGNKLPNNEVYGPGFTTDTELSNEAFQVANALTVKDENNVYNYTNHDSYIAFNGKWHKYNIYIRAYDEGDGYNSGRWLAVNVALAKR